MTQIVLNVDDISLLPSLKQILGAIKGVTIGNMTTTSSDIESEKCFVSDTIVLGFNEAKEGKFAGENLTSLDELVKELRTEAEQ